MLRSVTVFLFAGCLAQAAVWPEQFGTFVRSSAGSAAVTQRAVWDEYGLQASEQAVYKSGAESFRAEAFRFRDPTGALAAFQWQRPADAKPSTLGEHAAETGKQVIFAVHNYLFRFEGRKPPTAELAGLLVQLPQLDRSALPVLPGYLPSAGLTPNSERYVLGPVSLKAFEPRIPPSVAAFHVGAEAQLGAFGAGKEKMSLAVFSYPTPHIARDRVKAFSAIPGAVAKRSGPLVAVAFASSDPDEAEMLLAKVEYEATLTWNQYTPTRRDNIAHIILVIFELCGVLLLFCAGAGLAFSGLRLLARRLFPRWAGGDSVILLHIDSK